MVEDSKIAAILGHESYFDNFPPERLNEEMIVQVLGFYGLPEYDYTKTPEENVETTSQHLEKGKQIGYLMDGQFMHYLKNEKLPVTSDIVTILPLRGALGLETDGATLNQEYLPIEIKRNGVSAQIFYPDESRVEQTISQDRIIRIKDFGIATGATTIELAKMCIRLGVEPSKIVIQGAVGTRYAREAIAELSPDIKVLYAAEGVMQIERELLDTNPDSSQYLASVREFAKGRSAVPVDFDENAWSDHLKKDYYLNTVQNQAGDLQDVPAKDWGDHMYTTMNDFALISVFISKLSNLLTLNNQNEQYELGSLLTLYRRKFLQVA